MQLLLLPSTQLHQLLLLLSLLERPPLLLLLLKCPLLLFQLLPLHYELLLSLLEC